MARNTYKYYFKRGNKILRAGITNDLARSERENRERYGEDGYIRQVGNATDMVNALKWEREKTERGLPTRRQVAK